MRNRYIDVMNPKIKRKYTARIAFLIGAFFMLLGIAFLLGSLENTSLVLVSLALLFLLIGTFCAILAIRLNKRTLYLFFASFFVMIGIFLFLMELNIISLRISQAWPLLSVFSGLALLPVSWRRHGGLRLHYFVSSCALVILGCVLLFFSLKIVPFSFTSFIHTWWPMLFLLGGLTLVLISISSKGKRKE